MANSVRLPYTSVLDQQGATLIRPIVQILLVHNQRTFTAEALLDTGADVNVLPYHIGLELGLRWDEAKVIGGVSGNLAQVESRAVILDSIIAPFSTVRLLFVWIKSDAARLLLGQINFFQEFDVCFYAASNEFDISTKR